MRLIGERWIRAWHRTANLIRWRTFTSKKIDLTPWVGHPSNSWASCLTDVDDSKLWLVAERSLITDCVSKYACYSVRPTILPIFPSYYFINPTQRSPHVSLLAILTPIIGICLSFCLLRSCIAAKRCELDIGLRLLWTTYGNIGYSESADKI